MKKRLFIATFFYFLLYHSLEGKNAGVLPFAMHKGKPHFLLGQESSGKARNTWCDFGGKGESYETSQATAIREAFEETRGVLSSVYISKRLKTEILHPGRYYSLFLAKIDYFDTKKFEEGPGKDREKRDFKWVPAQDFIDTVKLSTDKYNTYYKDMHIRPQFVDFFTHKAQRNAIQTMLGLKLAADEHELEDDEGWISMKEFQQEEADKKSGEWIKALNPEEYEEEDLAHVGWIPIQQPKQGTQQKFESQLQNLLGKLKKLNHSLRP